MSRKIGVILSYVLMLLEVVSTLLLTPFIIRTLGQAEFGVYKLSITINAYLLLLDLGVGNAITRYVAKYRVDGDEEKQKQFLGVATVFYCIIAAVALVIGFVLIQLFPTVFAKGLSPSETALGQKLLAITMVNSAFTLGTVPFANVLIAYERFAASRGSSIIQIIFRMVFTFLAVSMNMGSVGIVTVNLITTVVCRSFFVFYVTGKLKLIPKFEGIKAGFIKEIVVYSSLILLQMVATQLNASVDQVLIGSLVTSSAVILAVYGVGTQIVQYFQSIGTAFTGVMMPGIVGMVERKASPKELLNEMVRIGRIIFMVLMLIWSAFLINGREFVILWAGAENSDAYIVALILMLAYSLVLTESIGTQVLWALNQHKEQSFLKIAIVLVNIILTVFLIKWQPLIGATLGTFISLIAGDIIVMNIIFIKKIKINLLTYYSGIFKGILPSALLSILCGWLLSLVYSGGVAATGVNLLLMTAVYAAAMWLFGMNGYETQLFGSLPRKIIRFKK